MTTIAWDGKTLATDSQWTIGSRKHMTAKKLDFANGCWVASAGHAGQCQRFLEWAREGFPTDAKPEDFEDFADAKDFTGVVLDQDGSIYEYGVELVAIPVHGAAAWGSGESFAVAAMDFGEDAVAAIEYVSSRDTNTGGEVQSVSLAQLKETKDNQGTSKNLKSRRAGKKTPKRR